MEKRVVQINPQRVGLAEHLRRDWVVNAEEGTTIQDVLQPVYWAHMAAQMQPYNRIEVREETGAWIVDLVVLACERNWARVAVLAVHELEMTDEAPPAADKHKVIWKGPQLKFCVLRIADSQVLQSGMDKQAAYDWMRNYEKALT